MKKLALLALPAAAVTLWLRQRRHAFTPVPGGGSPTLNTGPGNRDL